MNSAQKGFIAACLILYAVILSSIILNTNSKLSAFNQSYDSKKISSYYDSEQIEKDKSAAKTEVTENARTTGIIISLLFAIIIFTGKIVLYDSNTTTQKLSQLKQLKITEY